MELTLEQAVDAVITINSSAKMIFVNEAAAKMFGYDKKDLIGKNVNYLIKSDLHNSHNMFVANNLHSGINRVVGSGKEFELERKDGTTFWALLTLSKVTYLGETQYTAFIKDITYKKEVEESLKLNQERFNEIAQHTHTITWEVDKNGLYTYISNAVSVVLGYQPEEIINKLHFYDLHPANGREQFKKAAFDVFKQKLPITNLPNKIVTKSGKIIWVSTNGIPVVDAEGNLKGYRGSDSDITQKMLAETEVNLLKQAIESSSVSITLADAQQKDVPLIYVNQAFEQLTGYSKEEVLGKNCRFLHNEIEEKEALDIIRKGIKEGKNTSVILKNYRKNGVLFWNQLTISPIFDMDGVLTHFVGIQKDITDVKIAELELQASEEKFKHIANNVQEIFWLRNADNNELLYVNPAFELIYQEKVDSLYQNPYLFLEFTHPDDKQRLIDAYNNYFIIGFFDIEYRICRRDGEIRWLSAKSIPIKDKQGKILLHTGTAIDITDRKMVETALYESEKRFRSLFEDNASPMYLFDPATGKFIDLNQAGEEFYGYSKEEFCCLNIETINISVNDVAKKLEILKQSNKSRFEFKHQKKDGSIRDVEVFSSQIELDGQKFVYEIVHDITERNQFMHTIQAQNKILKDISWMQSHVVRAPLSRMMGLINLLEIYDFSSPDENDLLKSKEEVLQEITNSARELDSIIKEISEKTYIIEKNAQ